MGTVPSCPVLAAATTIDVMKPNGVVLLLAVALLGACGSDVRDESTGGSAASGQGGGPGTGATGGGGHTTTSGTSSTSSTSSTSTGVGGGPSFAACGEPGACTLAIDDCCGPCGDPSLDDFDAVNVAAVGDHAAAVCPDPGGTPCPGCAAGHDPNLFAYCDVAAGRCVGADLPETELASCETWEDCTLRAGAGCCEACGSPSDGSWGWVAIRGDAVDDLQSLLCAEDSACPECAPEEPEGLFAECLEGVCRVVVLEGGPPR